MRPDRRRSSTAAALGTLLVSLVAARAGAQTSDVTVCTPGALANCAELRLTATPGGGAGGTTLFEIAVGNLGSTADPTLPTSVYNLVFGTGLPAAPGAEVPANHATHAPSGPSSIDTQSS